MIRRPPRSTRTDTLFPYTTLFRSVDTVDSVSGLPIIGELDDPLQRPYHVRRVRRAGGRDARRPGLCGAQGRCQQAGQLHRSEEHTSELQSLMRISYAVFCLKKKKRQKIHTTITQSTNNHESR